jgi:hypothetical protein
MSEPPPFPPEYTPPAGAGLPIGGGAPPIPPIQPGPLGAGQNQLPPLPEYSFSNAFSHGAAVFKRHWGVLVLMMLIAVAMSFASSFFSELLGIISPVLSLVMNYGIQIFLLTPISYGVLLVATRMARGETSVSRVSIGNMFEPFKNRYWPSVLAGLMVFLVTFGAGIAAAIIGGAVGGTTWLALGMPNAGQPLEIVWIIGVVVFAVSFAIILVPLVSLMLVPVLVTDDRSGLMPVGRAVSTAWNLTRGKRLSIFAVVVCGGIIAALTVLLLCVGIVLVGLPYFLAIVGSAAAMLIRPLQDPNRCQSCGYNRGALPRCPECGVDNPATRAGRANPFGPDIPLRPYA